MDLFVYRLNTGLIGEISEYDSLEIERNYYGVSKLTLRLEKAPLNAALLQRGNLVSTVEDPFYAYYIDHFSVVIEDENKEMIEIFAYSMNYILSFRTIINQMVFSGPIESIVKDFIRYNTIDSGNYLRDIPGLIINNDSTITETATISRTGGNLLDTSFEILKDYEASIDVYVNLFANQFEVRTWKGSDRSIEQNVLPHVIFSQEYDNVIRQEYFDSSLDFKNVAVVAGAGEGVNRKVRLVGNAAWLQRREEYVDARDLQQTYRDTDNNEVTLTEAEYNEVLEKRGLENIAQKSLVQTFESTIDDVQYIIGVDYNLGDKVTFVDDVIGITKTVIVTSIKTTVNRRGKTVVPSFGTGLPNKLIN